MCTPKHTNVTYDLDDDAEYEVYLAVQKQPHKMRSKYLLQLAAKGLKNISAERNERVQNQQNDIVLEDIQKKLASVLAKLESGIIMEHRPYSEETSTDVSEAAGNEDDLIDESDLVDMLGDINDLLF